jgi:hypothetical protein
MMALIFKKLEENIQTVGTEKGCSIKRLNNDRSQFTANVLKPFLQKLIRNLEDRLDGCEQLAAFSVFEPERLP